MRILFCNNSFPGQFEALASYVASRPEHTVLFASRYGRRDFAMNGVRRILLKGMHERAAKGKDEVIRHWTWIAQAGQEAKNAFRQLWQSGFEPDMVLFSAGCGESLFLQNVFPGAFRVAYLDLFVPAHGGQDEKTALAFQMQGMALLQSHCAFALSGDARNLPAFVRPLVGRIAPFVDTDFFSAEKARAFCCDGVACSREMELLSFDMKGVLAADFLPAVLAQLVRERPRCHVLLSGCDPAGALFGALSELARSCPGRVHLRSMLSRAEYRDMLAAASVRIAPAANCRTRDLLEVLSCGTFLLANPAAITRSGALLPGKTLLTWPESAADQLCLLRNILDDRETRDLLGRNGQKAVRRSHAQKNILPRHMEKLLDACQRWKAASRAGLAEA